MNKQELARRIVRDMGYDYQTVRNIIDGIAFEGWLHDPDQVPGRTITVSEWSEYVNGPKGKYLAGADLLEKAGITVVPDPEPTNFELLEDLVDKWRKGPQYKTLTQYLDDCGVTAPGGDDDH